MKNKTISTVSVQRGRNELCLEKPGMITACSVHSCNVAATGSLHRHQPTCMYLLKCTLPYLLAKLTTYFPSVSEAMCSKNTITCTCICTCNWHVATVHAQYSTRILNINLHSPFLIEVYNMFLKLATQRGKFTLGVTRLMQSLCSFIQPPLYYRKFQILCHDRKHKWFTHAYKF